MPPPVATARREMRGPTGVEDILRRLGEAEEGLPPRAVTPRADDAASVMTDRTSNTTSKRKRSSNIAQPTGSVLNLNV
jgi:hypothetical protein